LGDKPSIALGNSLEKIGFRMGRLKTGKKKTNQIEFVFK
jgi:tRNA U34 5-carboxymethylaminomethyl modifying enzyme MnmG/GidA